MAAVLAMGDVVIKPIFGSMGHGMVRVSDPDVAFRVVRSLEQLRTVFYVQRAVDHGGRDVRVFVVGGRVLGAIERRAPDGRVAHERVARRIGAAVRAAAGVGAARPARGGGDRRRLRGRGSAAVARRHGLRARSERHPRLAGAEAGDRDRRRRRDRGPPGEPRACGRGAGATASRSSRRDQESRRGIAQRVRRGRARRAADVALRGAARVPARGRARRSRATCRRAATSPTRATRTSSPAPRRSASRLPAPARAARRDRAPGDRVHGALDALEHESRHRAAAGAARARGARWAHSANASDADADRRLPRRVRRVLEATTVDDARDVYAAIRPRGAGRARTGGGAGRRRASRR